MAAQAGFVHVAPEQLHLLRDRPELVSLFNQILLSLEQLLRAFDSSRLSLRNEETEKLSQQNPRPLRVAAEEMGLNESWLLYRLGEMRMH